MVCPPKPPEKATQSCRVAASARSICARARTGSPAPAAAVARMSHPARRLLGADGHGSGTINANSYRAVPDCKPSDFTSVGPNGSRSGVARLVKVLDSEKAACPKKVPPIMTFADPSRRYCFADV